MNCILVCDDEKDIVAAISIYLKSEGYEVLEAENGEEAVRQLRTNPVDLVLLDIMMPKKDGLATLNELRQFSNVPVIFLTAKAEDTDKVLGLNLGADDYITKPFNPVELLARVRSHLRRYTRLGSNVRSDILTIGGIELDDRSKEVRLDGEPVRLTPTEYEILHLLMQNAGQVYSPAEIYRSIWHEEPIATDNIVAVHIRHLREKLEYDPARPRYLQVVWGHGYKIEDGRRQLP